MVGPSICTPPKKHWGMAERPGPSVYSIAAHRGFADALVAGLVPRYVEGDFGLARLTLLLPSTRAQRIVTEAFIRHFGEDGRQGLLMPRMAVVGDLDLDETLGSLLDPLGAVDIPPAVDPMRRWLALAGILSDVMGKNAPKGATLLRFAREAGATIDRLLVEGVGPESCWKSAFAGRRPPGRSLAQSIHTFATVQRIWLAQLEEQGALDAAARRNGCSTTPGGAGPRIRPQRRSWRLAYQRRARTRQAAAYVADLPNGAVILPDLDLSMSDAVWDELGRAGNAPEPDGEVYTRQDAVTHPQYHLKLLLNRMGVARAEVPASQRALGLRTGAPRDPELVPPPEASKSWVTCPPTVAGLRASGSCRAPIRRRKRRRSR